MTDDTRMRLTCLEKQATEQPGRDALQDRRYVARTLWCNRRMLRMQNKIDSLEAMIRALQAQARDLQAWRAEREGDHR